MNIQKRQSIQKIVIDQAGGQRLILNDLILGSQGAEVVAQLIPRFHPNLCHLEIKGNNIDSQGFQAIFAALNNCSNLKSVEAQWNSLGNSPAGLQVLCHLVSNLQFLQFIDLKNNRISHQIVDHISEMIRINNRSLKVIDLRWNQLGEIGAQAIYKALAYNSSLKYIGLEDNRISLNSLGQIQTMLKNVARGTKQFIPPRQSSQALGWSGQIPPQTIFPISQNSYPSMQLQVINGQLRAKIQNQQNQSQIYLSKLKIQIDRTLQKMKVKGLQINEYQLKYDSLNNQNMSTINQLREAQRLLTNEKQRYVGVDKGITAQKSAFRTDKYNMNLKIQSLMDKIIQNNQRQIQGIQATMSEQFIKLQSYYRDRVSKKRNNRQKLGQLKQDILKLQMSKQNSWDRITQTYQNVNKNSLQQRCRSLEQLVAKAQFDMKSQVKRSQYLSEQLTSFVLKGLEKQQKIENQIFQTQNKIKDKHNQMGTTNVQIEENQTKSSLLQSRIIDKQSGVQMRRKYVKYIQAQSSVNLQIQRLKQQEDFKGEKFIQQTLQMRTGDLQKAIRIQQAQNKMIRNQYDKLLGQIETASKKMIQAVLFQQ